MIRLLLALALAPAQAGAFDLALPLDCTMGDSCFIQQYADRDPGPGARDFTCGTLSYDGHSGTDFALPSRAAMEAGVAVRAAAAGVVKGVRNGMQDIAANTSGAPSVEGRECGNGVMIEHAEGWSTQYCHMKQGSVILRPGDAVAVGAVLGEIGLSGATEFPHLHLTVRKDGRDIDPFDPDGTATCAAAPGPTLWATPLPYQPGGVIRLGFATAMPSYESIGAGLASPPTLASDAPALLVWAYAFGSRAGDTMEISITGPGGEVIREELRLERTQARFFRAAGRRLPANGWPNGPYSGTARLLRDGVEISARSIQTIVE